MSCDEIREQLVETARARELSSDLRKIVFGHVSDCPSCGAHLDNEQRLTHALSELATSTEGAPTRMEYALLRQLKVVPLRPAAPRSKTRRWTWSGLAVAAAAAAAFFVANTQVPASHSVPETTVVNSLAQDDSTDDFTPLPYAAELGPEEQAEMVRVQMPRQALLAMGVPVDASNADDQIQADVLVGMDGTARAIRIAN